MSLALTTNVESLESAEEPEQAITPLNSPQEGTVTGPCKNYIKCAKCRKDRKKCLPYPRNPNERCDRCKSLGHYCGPSERAPRRSRGSTAAQDMSATPGGTGSIAGFDTHGHHVSTSVSTAWHLGQGANFGRRSYALAVNNVAQQLFMKSVFDLEHGLKFEISRGGLCTGSTQLSQNLHDDLCDQIKHLQKHQLFGTNWTPKQRPTTSTGASEDTNTVDSTSGDFKITECSLNVLKRYEPPQWPQQGHVRNSVVELPMQYYEEAEASLKDFMTSISKDAAGRWTSPHYAKYHPAIHTYGPFPSCHIAYWNFDRNAAFELWRKCSRPGPVIDVLGRTFPHIVAEAGDSELLEKINDWACKTAGRDHRGLSLLDLGIIGDSPAVVRMVIDKHMVRPPFTRAMQRAIAGGCLEIASEHLLQHLTSTTHNDFNEINLLADLARHRGYTDLERRLGDIHMHDTSPQEALNSILGLDLNLRSDKVVVADEFAFAFPEMPDAFPLPNFPPIDNWSFSSEEPFMGSFQSTQTHNEYDLGPYEPHQPP